MRSNQVLSDADATEEIPRERWVATLAAFTTENRGAHANLEILSGEFGRFVELEDQPFEGISADVKDNEAAVWLSFGANADRHVTHSVQKVVVLHLLAASATHGAVIELQSEDGTRTLLQLSKPEDFAIGPPSTPEHI